MIIKDVIQGSPEWHSLRAQCFTASEAPAMAGVSKYQSRGDLLKQKFTGEVPEVTPAQQRLFDRGHAAEAAARHIAETIISEELYPVTGVSAEYPDLLASLDGCTMLEDVLFEHKLINDELRTATAETLGEHYKVQLDQQLLVSGADKCLFMASDGTEGDCNCFWYETTPERKRAIIDGWEQFKADLAEYQPQVQAVEPQGEAPADLPALSINLTGAVTASNLPDFKARALAMIDGIKTELVTDKDFADAESTVKFLQKGEKQLEASKQAALDQTASISELFETIDELRENMRQKRLHLNKLVKAEKENRRAEIHRQAIEAFDAFLGELESPVQPEHSLHIAGAMKNKRTIATLQAAADDEVAQAKIEARQDAKRLSDNKALIEESQGDYAFLFNDWRDLIRRDADFITLQVENRIAHHKQEEQKRLDAERERIRQEEAAKARAEAERRQAEEAAKAKAEAQRQADEEAAEKRRAEAAQREDAERAQESEARSHNAIPAEDTISVSEAIAGHEQSMASAPAAEQPEIVTITRTEYEWLLAAQAELDALKAHGVDNWPGYSDAMADVYATD